MDIKLALTATLVFVIGWALVNIVKPDDAQAETWKVVSGSVLLIGILLFIASAITAIWIRIP